ncbi:glycosyltransferase [Vibrio splendidus]
MKNIIYTSLTGMNEALGKSQVLAYILKMNKANRFHLISFEKNLSKQDKEELEALLSNNNIDWYPIKYSNRFGVLSTVFQLIIGMYLSLKIAFKNKIFALHARSMIAALMVYPISRLLRLPLVFDIRDFATDEKVDRGRIKKGSLLYKISLMLEHILYRHSRKIIALTKVSRDILVQDIGIEAEKIYIIPTCADQDIFYSLGEADNVINREKLGFSDEDFLFIHVGSVREWYLFDEELKYFKYCLEINNKSKLLILNNYDHEYIYSKLVEYNIPTTSICKVLSVDYSEVNAYLNISDVALYFIVPSFSKKAAAPTKFAEFVRVNLPSITNAGVGDMEYYINTFKVGFLVDPYALTKKVVEESLDKILNIDDARYEELFCNYFSVDVAIKEYQRVYDEI